MQDDISGPVGAIVDVGEVRPRRHDQYADHHHAEVHVAEASRRPPRGFLRKPQLKCHRNYATGNSHKSKTFQPRHDQHKPVSENCHKCGPKGHFAKDCKTSRYLVDMYRKLQQLRNQPHQKYNFDTSNQPSLDYDVEHYMTIYEQSTSNPDVALLDSASIPYYHD